MKGRNEIMKTVDMTKGSPVKLLIQFSIPILIGNLFQQIYTLADRIIVGRFVGDKAFSAIGATNALSMMFMSMCMGAAIGTGVVVSQYFGAKDEKGTAASQELPVRLQLPFFQKRLQQFCASFMHLGKCLSLSRHLYIVDSIKIL